MISRFPKKMFSDEGPDNEVHQMTLADRTRQALFVLQALSASSPFDLESLHHNLLRAGIYFSERLNEDNHD